MKPLDIDGNELKVGDLVEVVHVNGFHRAEVPTYTPGSTSTIDEILSYESVYEIVTKRFRDAKPKEGVFVGLVNGWYKVSTDLRLIATPDTKAPTKIEFVTTKEGVR